MRGALDNAPGVSKTDIAEGHADFTVHYDSAKIKPEEIVSKLVAGGEEDARIKS